MCGRVACCVMVACCVVAVRSSGNRFNVEAARTHSSELIRSIVVVTTKLKCDQIILMLHLYQLGSGGSGVPVAI